MNGEAICFIQVDDNAKKAAINHGVDDRNLITKEPNG